jgi:hypothetical protein
MRVTIVPEDYIVYVDGVPKTPIDLSFMSDVHAVQWYDTWGDVERVDPITRIPSNERIEELGRYQQAVDLWNSWTPPEPV